MWYLIAGLAALVVLGGFGLAYFVVRPESPEAHKRRRGYPL